MAAWVSSGLGSVVLRSLFGGREEHTWQAGTVLVAGVTIAATAIVFAGRRGRVVGWAGRSAMAGLLALSTLTIAAAIVSVGNMVTDGLAVALGTVALAASTVGLALLASRLEIVEAGWLVYPTLGLTGLKVLSQDLGSGRAVVLVVALASYGAALVVAPRLLRSGRAPSGDATLSPAGGPDDG